MRAGPGAFCLRLPMFDASSASVGVFVGPGRLKRRTKTAAERRQQGLRAEARALQRCIAALQAVLEHRGCQLGRLGSALLHAVACSNSSGLCPRHLAAHLSCQACPLHHHRRRLRPLMRVQHPSMAHAALCHYGQMLQCLCLVVLPFQRPAPRL